MTWWQWLLAVAFFPAALFVAMFGWVWWLAAVAKAWRAHRRWVEERVKAANIARLAHAMATGEMPPDGPSGLDCAANIRASEAVAAAMARASSAADREQPEGSEV